MSGMKRIKEAFNYETFKKKPEEDIKTIFDRFTIIINGLKSYGKTYSNEEVVRKMLQSLPKSWEAKVTAIEEAKNLETLSLDELIEKVEKKKVGVALKSKTIKESESSDDVDENKEMAMFTNKFKIFMRSNKGRIS
ncbi:UBN2 domain-containing protein [Gossypium australe]|uniref:UBN2 domain-containing protein n=1 Tax=Gossypium australe TaxID=47621 RepID=A0A5B6VDD7_9ROSI|nr:UBN2 domain-containing protein [Gossypium australe]